MNPLYNITDLTWDGRGVSRTVAGQVAFISGAIPGDKVTAVFGYSPMRGPKPGNVKEVVYPSPDRTEHPCPHYCDFCPASALGAMQYEAALRWKRKHIHETIRRIGHIADPRVMPVFPSPSIWDYRGRVELHLVLINDNWRLAYHGPDSFVPIETCLLATKPVQEALKNLNANLARAVISPDLIPEKDDEPAPILRIMVRDNGFGKAIALLFIITGEERIDWHRPLIDWLRKTDLAGWRICRSASVETRLVRSETIAEEGDTHIAFRMQDTFVSMDPTVFSQVNRPLTDGLIETVLEFVPRHGKLLDLYGGFGMFSLAHAMRGGRGTVVELSGKACDAGKGFVHDHRLSVGYIEQDLAQRPFRYQEMSQFDALIVDPPRSGLHQGILRQINVVGPRRLIYVSCHPAALARDLARFTSYIRISLNPIDLFPQTPEVEVVAVMERVR